MDPWMAELQAGRPEAGWDLFLGQYRRLVLATIRHYAQDYDDVMEVFAHVCGAMRENDFHRLRHYLAQPSRGARFGTWLVSVVRNLTIDWFRHRDGRRRVSAIVATMPPLRQRIFEHIFVHRRSHVETYEIIRATNGLDLSFGRFLLEVSATYRAALHHRRGHLLRDLGAPGPVRDGKPSDVAAGPRLDTETREALEDALLTLPAEDRVAVELYVLDELRAEEVARILGLPNAKAVYNRVYRALAALRRQLEQAGVGGSGG